MAEVPLAAHGVPASLSSSPSAPELDEIVRLLRASRRVLVTSHQRPDGDAIGSAYAAALALRGLGKEAIVAFDDTPPYFLQPFPSVADALITQQVDEVFDAVVVMECGSLERTGIKGLERSPVINIDHHPGNTRYGQVNWVDETAAACGELVHQLLERLGTPFEADIATHLYLAILTDTGSFHFSHLSPRTYAIAGQMVAAGADPHWVARTHYDSASLARVRLFGAVLHRMVVGSVGRTAVLHITRQLAAEAGGNYDDTEGLINFPLSVRELVAVAYLKEQTEAGQWRVSLRSKGAVDVGVVARTLGGGGHANASGCEATGNLETLQTFFLEKLDEAVAATAGVV